MPLSPIPTRLPREQGGRQRKTVWLGVGFSQLGFHWTAKTKKAVWNRLQETERARILEALRSIKAVLTESGLLRPY